LIKGSRTDFPDSDDGRVWGGSVALKSVSLKNLAGFQDMMAGVAFLEVTYSVADANTQKKQGSYSRYVSQGKE